VRTVAADPGADRTTFGVPLTVAEVAELWRRSWTAEGLKDAILPYALAQPDYGGAWIDHERGGLFVVQFSSSLLEHQAAILPLTRPGAAYEVRQVRWSQAELDVAKSRISGDSAWFETLPAYLLGVGLDIRANRVTIEVSSADPEVATRIWTHYGLGSDILTVTSDGTGVLLMDPGALAIRAVDRAGKPVVGLACVVSTDAKNVHEPRPLPMPTTDDDGLCEIEALPGEYTIELEDGGAGHVVAVGVATVKTRTLTEVELLVE
jgi:hypothetical protein